MNYTCLTAECVCKSNILNCFHFTIISQSYLYLYFLIFRFSRHYTRWPENTCTTKNRTKGKQFKIHKLQKNQSYGDLEGHVTEKLYFSNENAHFLRMEIKTRGFPHPTVYITFQSSVTFHLPSDLEELKKVNYKKL